MKLSAETVLELREKMNRFNVWEFPYIRQLSAEERSNQFVELFELGMQCDAETIERAHKEHMEQFIRFAAVGKT